MSNETKLLNLASDIYHEAFGDGPNDISDTTHYHTKAGEIYDWLANGDEGKGRSRGELVAEWREYDSVEEDTND